MLSDEGDEDEDDTNRLSELIGLAEVGIQMQEVEDNTGRLSELIALAETGLQAEEDEDAFFSQPQRPQMKRRPLTTGDRQIREL